MTISEESGQETLDHSALTYDTLPNLRLQRRANLSQTLQQDYIAFHRL